MSGVEIHALLWNEAQYKQIGPVPPLAPVPPKKKSTTISPSTTKKVQYHH